MGDVREILTFQNMGDVREILTFGSLKPGSSGGASLFPIEYLQSTKALNTIMSKDKNEEKMTSKVTLPLDQQDEIGCMFVMMLFPCLPLSVLEIQGNRMSKFHGRPHLPLPLDQPVEIRCHVCHDAVFVLAPVSNGGKGANVQISRTSPVYCLPVYGCLLAWGFYG